MACSDSVVHGYAALIISDMSLSLLVAGAVMPPATTDQIMYSYSLTFIVLWRITESLVRCSHQKFGIREIGETGY